MIASLFLNLAYYSLTVILSLFPDSSGLPTEIQDAFATIGGYTTIFSHVMPLYIILWCLSIIIIAESIVFTFRGFGVVMSHFPFVRNQLQPMAII